jgi:hypothetical protein
MNKPLLGKTKLSIENAPVVKKREAVKEKLGLISKHKTKMRSFRLRTDTIDTLHELTKAVNNKTNIKISATNIIELLIRDAAKEGGEKIIQLINQ